MIYLAVLGERYFSKKGNTSVNIRPSKPSSNIGGITDGFFSKIFYTECFESFTEQ